MGKEIWRIELRRRKKGRVEKRREQNRTEQKRRKRTEENIGDKKRGEIYVIWCEENHGEYISVRKNKEKIREKEREGKWQFSQEIKEEKIKFLPACGIRVIVWSVPLMSARTILGISKIAAECYCVLDKF